MKTIYKYQLEISDAQEIAMPANHRIIYVADQDGFACLWAEVDTQTAVIMKKIICRGTGHSFLGNEGRYLGSVVQPPFVWHFYEGN